MNFNVSFIMSVRNGEPYLEKSIKSVLNQTFQDFEFIIVDDGSTDNSWKIIDSYAQKDKRIITIKHENIGLTKSLNKGIKLAKNDLIARQDCDDISHPKRAEYQTQWFKKSKNRVLCGSRARKIHNGKINNIWHTPLESNQIKKSLKFQNVFNHSSVMFRKMIGGKLVLYNSNLRFAQDYELWSRLSKAGEVGNLKEYLVDLNITINNISHQYRELQRLNAILVALSNNYKELGHILMSKIDIEVLEKLYQNKKYRELIEILVFIYNINFSKYKASLFKCFKNYPLFILKNFNQMKFYIIKKIINEN